MSWWSGMINGTLVERYRLSKLTYPDGDVRYVVQRKETVSWSNHHYFKTLEEAEKDLKELQSTEPVRVEVLK